MIFAVASEDAVHLYDTQQSRPFAYLANLHYHTLSDLTWLDVCDVCAVGCSSLYFKKTIIATVFHTRVLMVILPSESGLADSPLVFYLHMFR